MLLQLLAIPLPLRLAALALVGLAAGVLANLAAYRLAWFARPISPWSARSPNAPPRRRLDRLPVVGWLGLRREASLHGRGFWIRPLLVEAGLAAALPALYYWETALAGLLPDDVVLVAAPAELVSSNLPGMLHAQFLAHAILAWLMLVASLIDLDEKTIPDAITVPGTMLGLLLAAGLPWMLLPEMPVLPIVPPPPIWCRFVHAASPRDWPAWAAFPSATSLATAWGCWTIWCLALLPRKWQTRRGWGVAWLIFVRRLRRDPSTPRLALLWLVGGAALALVWRLMAEASWVAVMSSLIGIVASAALVWGVRLIGSAVLQREAMGFGDVTLLGMIGAFLGWQAGLLVFFVAPLAAVVVGVVQRLVVPDDEIPYGPFLCLASVAVLLSWRHVWPKALQYFEAAWLVPTVVLVGLVLLGVLLVPVHWLMNRMRG